MNRILISFKSDKREPQMFTKNPPGESAKSFAVRRR
jgi:hypothetical protein